MKISLILTTTSFRRVALITGFASALAAAFVPAYAKLPVTPPTPESIAKAEDAKSKAAEAAKLANDQLAAAQDKVAASWAAKLRSQGKEFKPTPIAAAPAPAAAPAVTPGAAPKK